MQSWLAKKLISFVMGRTRAGRRPPHAVPRRARRRAHLPGPQLLVRVFRGKAEVARWLRRFAAVGIQIFPDEVVAKGFPWSTTVCVRGHDYLRDAHGERVYENRYVIWGRMAWGRLKRVRGLRGHAKGRRLGRVSAAHRPELAVVLRHAQVLSRAGRCDRV